MLAKGNAELASSGQPKDGQESLSPSEDLKESQRLVAMSLEPIQKELQLLETRLGELIRTELQKHWQASTPVLSQGHETNDELSRRVPAPKAEFDRIISNGSQVLRDMGIGDDRDMLHMAPRQSTYGYNSVRTSLLPQHAPSSEMYQSVFEWVTSDAFEYSVGMIILANSISIGVQTEYKATHWNDSLPFSVHVMNCAFSLCFGLELFLRALAYSSTGTIQTYLCNNCLDCAVIFFLLFDEAHAGWRLVWNASQQYNAHHAFSILRIVRVFRLVRTIRSSAFLRATAQLRAFLISVFDSLQAIVWAIVLILVITYIFSIYFTMIVTEYKVENFNQGDDSVLLTSFGSVGQTMRSLYLAALNGQQWYDIAKPLATCSSWHVFVFMGYMTICLLGVLNMITGVFITSALRFVEKDQKSVIKIQLQELLHSANVDQSGILTQEELGDHLQNLQLVKYLDEIDLAPEDARNLFRLLDYAKSGEVSIDELVGAAVGLHGPAKALDLAVLRFRQEEMMQLVSRMYTTIMQRRGRGAQ